MCIVNSLDEGNDSLFYECFVCNQQSRASSHCITGQVLTGAEPGHCGSGSL